LTFKKTAEREGLDVLRGEANGTWFELHGPNLSIGVETPAQAWPVIDKLRTGGLTIRGFQPMRPSLEDLFMQVAEHSSSDGGAKR
jgi:hypothetical protein